MSDLRADPFAAHRPLWEELDTVQQAVRAAIAADDMQAWAEHAGRGAAIYEELARLSGWRDETQPDDPIDDSCPSCHASLDLCRGLLRDPCCAECTHPRET